MRSLMQWILIHIFNSHVSLTKAFGTYIFIEDGWDFVPQKDAMETQRKCGITASDIDAISPVLDAPRFLRRPYQAHPKKFSQMLEKLRYPDAAHWGAVVLSQGLELQDLTVLERQFPSTPARWEEKTMQGPKGPGR